MTDLEKIEKVKESREKHRFKKNKRSREHYEINKERIIKKCKEYYEKNKQQIRERNNKHYELNKEKKQAYYKLNIEHKKEYLKNYNKNRAATDPLYKLRRNIGTLIGNSIRNQGFSKKTKTYQILGCTFEEFKQHIDRQFTAGMSWSNRKEWHLDHIYPISLAKDEADVIRLNHYTNFQPLWVADNKSKRNKIIANTQIKLI